MNDIKSEGIMIFKDTMEYLTEGILTAEQFAELVKMIYAVRWGDGVDEKEIKDKLLLGIWKTLKHTIKKSARNARHYEKKKVQQETQNKGTGSTQIVQDDNLYYQEGESASECPRISENNTIEVDFSTGEIKTEQQETLLIQNNMEDTNNSIDTEDKNNIQTFINTNMGNPTNIYFKNGKYTEEQKEVIKQKVIEKNTPKQQEEKVAKTFEEFVSDNIYILRGVITDLASGIGIKRKQALQKIEDMEKTYYGNLYKNQMYQLINNMLSKQSA